jgi:hypothetical protein
MGSYRETVLLRQMLSEKTDSVRMELRALALAGGFAA